MNYRDISHWKTHTLGDGFIYCIQRLDELLFDYTIDSFKPRALNSPSLCVELLDTINEVEQGNIDKKNIEHIISELRHSLKRDKVAKKLLSTNVDYFINYDDKLSLRNLKLKVSVLERSLERYRYIQKIQSSLYNSIVKNNKDDINYFISNYVTTFINWGISKHYLYEKMNQFFFNKDMSIDSNEKIIDFFELVYPRSHNYSVFFKVAKNITNVKESFRYFSIRFADLKDKDTISFFEKYNFFAKPNEVILEILLNRLPDPYIARDIAESRLETIRNTSHLYFHNSKLYWSKYALIAQRCCRKDITIATGQINPMRKSFNYKSNDVSKNTNKIFQHIALHGDSFKKFNRILEIHSNCLQNLTPDNQLINLWTIFETIIPTVNKSSKVERISQAVTPLLLLRYYHKLISNLLGDFIRWDNKKSISILSKIDINTDSHLMRFGYFLSSLKYDDLRKELYEDLGAYHLLRNRIFKFSETLMSKKNLLLNLKTHRMNVSWQIRRVYRTRNMIVHSGKTPKYINILVENTHDYIDQVIEEIIDMSTSNYRIYTLEQAFEFGKILNMRLEAKIKNSSDSNDYMPYLLRENVI